MNQPNSGKRRESTTSANSVVPIMIQPTATGNGAMPNGAVACRGTVQRSHWARCHRPVAGRHIYAALLAYDRAELREARQSPQKQGVRVTGSRRCVCPRFRGAPSQGKIVSDDRNAPGVEVGRPKDTYRRVRIDSTFGKIAVLVTDGQLPYPYGREISGYEVANLADTVSKAKATGPTVLVDPYTADGRQAAIISFPGGYIAEIYSAVSQ